MKFFNKSKVIYDWDELPLLMTTGEVANLLHSTDDHIRSLAANGVIKGSKFSRRWLINKHDLKDYLKAFLTRGRQHEESKNNRLHNRPALTAVGHSNGGTCNLLPDVSIGIRRAWLSCNRRRDVARCNSRCCGLVWAGMAMRRMV